MTIGRRPERTLKDGILVGISLLALSARLLIQMVDGPDELAAAFVALAILTGLWAAWRWYDREPDRRRGE